MGLLECRRKCTVEEYLRLERAANFKSEYIDGEIYAMAGTSRSHDRICWNIILIVGPQIDSTQCEGRSSDARISVTPGGPYVYADVVIASQQVVLDEPEQDNLVNPKVVFEVLSPSTADYDRTLKFAFYKRIPSFTDYILVEQDRALVEHWRRSSDGEWANRHVSGLDAVLEIDSVACKLPLAQIYKRVL
jgi:Uma2 family endonuclease